MTESVPLKIALGFAIGAFAFMVFGSVLAGARFVTALIRGIEGALVFGVVAWLLSGYLLNRAKTEAPSNDSEPSPETEPKTEEKLATPAQM